jgi:hypothetical protein
MGTHLILWDEGFYHDGIIRRLLAIELRNQELGRYIRLCAHAMALYCKWLGHHPESGYLLAIETVYQQIQHYAVTRTTPKGKVVSDVCRTLEHYLDKAAGSFERRQRLMNLKNALDRDWEWKFTINSVLGPGTDTLISTALGLDTPLDRGGSSCL